VFSRNFGIGRLWIKEELNKYFGSDLEHILDTSHKCYHAAYAGLHIERGHCAHLLAFFTFMHTLAARFG